MEKILLAIFLALFIGRMVLRYVLQQLNMNNLKACGKEIPPGFEGVIDKMTMGKMVDYAYDQSKLESKENLVGDVIELVVLFLLLPVLVGRLVGLQFPIIPQSLIFFAALASSAVLPICRLTFITPLFWSGNTDFPPSPGNCGSPI